MKTAPRPQRRRLTPAARRAQLLVCAISAFAEHGIARVTHAHVAARAGVSDSAVHSYFRTRKDLVAATLSQVETTLIEIVANTEVDRLPVREALTSMVGKFDAAARENSDVITVWLDWSTGFRADVWPRYLLMQDRLHSHVRKALSRGKRQRQLSPRLDPKAAARLFVGGGHTIALMRFAGATNREIQTLIDHLIDGVTCIGMQDRVGHQVPAV